jgi:hypothetical protein
MSTLDKHYPTVLAQAAQLCFCVKEWPTDLPTPGIGYLEYPSPKRASIVAVVVSTGDGKANLFVYNYQHWWTPYLVQMISEGIPLWNWVGE